MMCQRIGLPPISTIGFGRSTVSSANRVPRPPASITAFIVVEIVFSGSDVGGMVSEQPNTGFPIALPILGAAGAIKLAAMPGDGVRWSRALVVLTLASLIGANGLRLQQMGSFVADHLAQFPPRIPAEFRVVLHNHRGYYGYDLIQNDPWLRGGEIVLLAEETKGRALVDHYFPGVVEAGRNRYGVTFVGGTRQP